jgi:hypothetical protein
VKDPQPLGLFNVGLAGLLCEQLPPPSELFGDLRVVLVRSDLDDLAALQLRPDHEGIHRPLDVVRRVLLRLEKKQTDRIKIGRKKLLRLIYHSKKVHCS